MIVRRRSKRFNNRLTQFDANKNKYENMLDRNKDIMAKLCKKKKINRN